MPKKEPYPGDLREITRLALLCGASFWEDNGLINHTQRTLVIAPDGTLRRIFTDNDWKSEELADELLKGFLPAGGTRAVQVIL